MSEWISVEDRLPENWVDVLIYGIDGDINISHLDSYGNLWMIAFGQVIEAQFITHWQRLPDASTTL